MQFRRALFLTLFALCSTTAITSCGDDDDDDDDDDTASTDTGAVADDDDATSPTGDDDDATSTATDDDDATSTDDDDDATSTDDDDDATSTDDDDDATDDDDDDATDDDDDDATGDDDDFATSDDDDDTGGDLGPCGDAELRCYDVGAETGACLTLEGDRPRDAKDCDENDECPAGQLALFDTNDACGCFASCEIPVVEVPTEWTCDESYYQDGFYCDCDCGAVDPDCVEGAPAYNCPEDAFYTCDAAGECAISQDGDCEDTSLICLDIGTTGICITASEEVPEGTELCDENSECPEGTTPITAPDDSCVCLEPCIPPAPVVPDGWTCDPEYYDVGDGCDCDCGVVDPDCATQSDEVYNCPDDGRYTCSATGTCEEFEIPTEWTCEADFYAAADGCDCDCGVLDPDCDEFTGTDVLNCPTDAAYTCSAAGACTFFADAACSDTEAECFSVGNFTAAACLTSEGGAPEDAPACDENLECDAPAIPLFDGNDDCFCIEACALTE